VSHRFLIVRLGSLGDVVHAIPAAAALRARFPEARIDWLVDPRYVPLLDMVRGIDSRVPVDTRRVGATLRIARDLRGVGYNAVIDLQGLLKSAVLARAAGGERTIGFPREHLREPMARAFYTDTPDPRAAEHVIFKNLALLEPLGLREARVEFPLDIPHSSIADQVRSRFGGAPYALINPGAAWPNKRWLPARFGALAEFVRERFGVRSVVLWGPGEEARAQEVVTASSGAAEIAPPTSIPDLFALAKHARLMLSGDTGPLHIAAAVGTPVVALFGPTRAVRNGPWAPRDIVVARTEGCGCLYERRCRRGAPCIEDIAIAEVSAAVERRLSGPAGDARGNE
jgi:heptosyltransferase I